MSIPMNEIERTSSVSMSRSVDVVPAATKVQRKLHGKAIFQIGLLLNKRAHELRQNPTDLLKLYIGPCLFFVLVILFYEQFGDLFKYHVLAYGTFETYLIPPAFWIIIVKTVTYAMNEKSTRIKESMRMMGLLDISYYVALFMSEGIVGGFLLSMVTSWFTFYPHFFNDAPYGDVFALFFVNCLASVPFALFWCSFFDTAQTASQALLLFLIGAYALFAGVLATDSTFNVSALACLLPPLGFQVGCNYLSNPSSDYGHSDIEMVTSILFADIFLYTALGWYFSQVMPSSTGVSKHPLFFLKRTYWSPRAYGEGEGEGERGAAVYSPSGGDGGGADGKAGEDEEEVPIEHVDEKFLGRPSVVLRNLRKSFNGHPAVRDLSFKMYRDQITCLLGHNGAGKTTTINMLTGALPCDYSGRDSGAWVHGLSIHDQMDEIRKSLGVCPQHDVLFESLSVFDTILFFSQLKGYSYREAAQEAEQLCRVFHLERRKHHLGSELSGGQRRKLSVAIAVCGGSSFVILDEPTAGMDPLARRELWDLLSSLRKGRTMLLTTHYMDECNVLADRTAIINLGGLACLGSNGFLKNRLGAGYRLVLDVAPSQTQQQAKALSAHVLEGIEGAVLKEGLGERPSTQSTTVTTTTDRSIVYSLPLEQTAKFGEFLTNLGSPQQLLDRFGVSNYGINIADLEEVFLSVGSDATVTPMTTGGADGDSIAGIGGNVSFSPTMATQLWAIYYRRLSYASNDGVTIPMLLLPVAGVIGAAVVSTSDLQITPVEAGPEVNDIMVAFCVGCIYFGSFLAVPGLLGEFLITERHNRCRNLLTVMGCDFRAYWLGSFLADYSLLSLPLGALYASWIIANMTDFLTSNNGAAFFVFLLFTAQIIAFGYLWSSAFSSAKACAALMPLVTIGLFLLPMVLIMLGIVVWTSLLDNSSIDLGATIGALFWGIALTSPHGGLLVALMDTTSDFQNLITGYPPFEAVMAIMAVQCACFLGAAYTIDIAGVMPLEAQQDPSAVLPPNLDEDVVAERARALDSRLDTGTGTGTGLPREGATAISPLAARGGIPTPAPAPAPRDADVMEAGADEGQPSGAVDRFTYPLRVKGLRKVFPGKQGGRDVVATQDAAFCVAQGECFGLLGANGAGKSSTISMVTRHLVPTAGDAFINGTSILSDFTTAAQCLGVVTQNNSLWDLLNVEQHLRLFARLRGVPGDRLEGVVSSTLDQMELRPHRRKLACRLSGGMKRKLCVAISLIGDPAVVLLDEPSAGLDPKSRRNLWDVILRTMSHRSVVLTTHSLEEAEALCGRIGIMVKGQLRVLGTKQHLKNKFGSGYEVVVKLSQEKIAAGSEAEEQAQAQAQAARGSGADHSEGGVKREEAPAPRRSFAERERERARQGYVSAAHEALLRVEAFLKEALAPSVRLVNTNGAVLATFSVPRRDMQVGRAFSALEENKERLCIEEYTISQPTLEQVFIRTVNRHTPKLRKADAGAKVVSTQPGGANPNTIPPSALASSSSDSSDFERSSSVRLSVSGTLDAEGEEDDEAANAELGQMNDCGCLPWHLRYIAYVFTFLAALFIFLGASGARKFRREDRPVPTFYQVASPVGFIFIIVACAGCWCMCCPCCNTRRAKGGLDE